MTLRLRSRDWLRAAIRALESEAARSADTHLLRLSRPAFPGIDLYFKDEAAHPSGSLKHRLARSLYLYALCNGRLDEGQAVVDASSGSTAISEAWFARHLGITFTAVLPASTSPAKLSTLRDLGAHYEVVDDPSQVKARARGFAANGACYLDQFGLAERATDWRGNNNIAESILSQLAREPNPVPAWIVCGAGTGGTSATIGRYLRYRGLDTRLCGRAARWCVCRRVASGSDGRLRLAVHSDRRDWSASCGVRLLVRGRGCRDRSRRCDVHRRGMAVGALTRPALRRLVRHESRRLPGSGRRPAGPRGAWCDRELAVRSGRALCRYAVRLGLVAGSRAGPSARNGRLARPHRACVRTTPARSSHRPTRGLAAVLRRQRSAAATST